MVDRSMDGVMLKKKLEEINEFMKIVLEGLTTSLENMENMA